MFEDISEASVHTNVKPIKRLMSTYMAYYTFDLLSNVFLIALYVVQVFSSHADCLSHSGFNTTPLFQLAFKAGLSVLTAEAINSNIFQI